MFEQKHSLVRLKIGLTRKFLSAQFYSISYLQLKIPKEDKMAALQCSLCCPLVFRAIFALLPFSLFLRCLRPCDAPLPVVYTILDISETSFFVTPIGFLSTRNRWIRLPRQHLKLLSRPEAGGGGYSLWWPIGVGSARKGYPFQASGIWKRRDFTCWKKKYIKNNIRVGKSVVWVCKRAQGVRDEFYGFIKSRKRSIFEIDSYFRRQCICSS